MGFEEISLEERKRIRGTESYKAMMLALTDNSKTLTSRESIYESNLSPFLLFSPLNGGSPNEPIVEIPLNGSATILEKTMPQNAEGRVHYVGVNFVTGASNYITFNFIVNGQILPEMSKVFLYESFTNMIPIKLPLTNRSTLKVIGFNSDPGAAHKVKMIMLGYYRYLES